MHRHSIPQLNEKIRALIIDDEPYARDRVRQLLETHPRIEIIGECGDGLTALAMIKERAPDLLFLDIRIPELDGFEVLERTEPGRMPVVIFFTAYDQYAIRAFEACALDYLLKPCDEERFVKAVQRAEAQLSLTSKEPQAVPWVKKDLDRIVVKSGGRVYFLTAKEIDWIEAQGNYVRIHLGRVSYLLRESLNQLELELDPHGFVRIHRSTLVNVERIKELQPMFHGQYTVILRDGTEITMSRRYRHKLEEAVGRPI